MRKKYLILFILKLLKFPISMISFVVIAKFFGVSFQRDAWVLVYATILSIDIAIWGPINDIFRTKFIKIREKDGIVMALSKTKSLIFFMMIFSSLIVLFIEFFPNVVVDLISHNIPQHKRELLVSMFKWLAPLLIFNQVTLILTSILNAFNSFYGPEISSFLSQVINILIILWLSPIVGIYSMLIGSFVSLIILIIVLIYLLRKTKIKIIDKLEFKFADFTVFLFFALPLYSSYLLSQLNSIIEKRLLTNLGEGAVSIVDFARKFPDIFNSLLMSVVLTVLVPTLTTSFYKNDHVSFNKDFLESYRLVLLGLGFYFSIMVVGSEPIIELFYINTAIDSKSLNEIINLNIYYSMSLFGIFTYILFGMVLISIGKNKKNALIGAITQILSIIINFLFVNFFGIIVFPLSLFITHLVTGLIMAYFYPFSKTAIVKTTFTYYSFLILSVLIVFLLVELLNCYYIVGNITKIITLVSLNFLVFFTIGNFFKIEEFRLFSAFINQKFKTK